jgi:UDP-GlcNAc:undecaprenyl-phosphate GlcNAc-1-phosphate transferase
MLLLGLLDDLFELKVIHKFWGETIIVLFFLWSSKLTTEIIFIPPALNFILTFIWILGITNAFNLLDILDGLATGVSFLVSLSFFFLAYITGNMWVGIISIILSACLLAVWFLNLPPAKVYLGDSGSLFLGFIFSTMAISISYTKPLHEIALFSPVLILGFPIYDTVFVSLMRILRKKPVFVKTDDHFVFKLIASGKKRTTSLFICYFMTGIFITLGIVLTALTNCFGMVLLSATLIFLIPISFKVSRVRN